jgi:hypothetical protein
MNVADASLLFGWFFDRLRMTEGESDSLNEKAPGITSRCPEMDGPSDEAGRILGRKGTMEEGLGLGAGE